MVAGEHIQMVECPRDAMQGWKHHIATEDKINYLNQLLKVGFDTLDFGSFVSPKKVPQMADTSRVVSSLRESSTGLLSIVANARGASLALAHENIRYLGFPFSVSPTFQRRNINSTVEESFQRIIDISKRCKARERKLVVYISMAFGNPYGDQYDHEVVLAWIQKIVDAGVSIISLSDTVGVASPVAISNLFGAVSKAFPQVETGVHLHSRRNTWQEKMDAALESGCRRFDGTLHGIGGCPMANDKLVGNMDSFLMIPYLLQRGYKLHVDPEELARAAQMATEIFS